MRENIPSFVAIESDLLLDRNLTSTDKLLYGIICALSTNKECACFAKSTYICQLINIQPRQLRNCIRNLKKYNYILVNYKYGRRYMKPTVNKFLQNRNRTNNVDNNVNSNLSIFDDYDWLDDDY